MNSTITKFGYPESLVCDYQHWVVLLRPKQPTLGSLVLARKGDELAAGDLPAEAFAELALISANIEQALSQVFSAERFNYLMLMMVDPHVHYHVIPRYSSSQKFAGTECGDSGWPALPNLGEVLSLDSGAMAELLAALRLGWPQN